MLIATILALSQSQDTSFSCKDVKHKNLLFCEDWSNGISPLHWSHETSATGGGNGEFQMYTSHPRNSFVKNGSLYLKPSFTYNTFGDLRGDLDLYAMGCTKNWNSGCSNAGSLHHESGNQKGKYWSSSEMVETDMNEMNKLLQDSGLPKCETKNKVCNIMVPVGGMRKSPIMSAKLMSKQAFKYGRFEFVATLPKGDYLWPAIWMLPESQLPWPLGGEIDIMESMGNKDKAFTLNHNSSSSALHLGTKNTWYDLAYTPAYEELLTSKKLPKRDNLNGPTTFGLYWNENNLYTYINDDNNRVLDMDQMFRMKAQKLMSLQHKLTKCQQEAAQIIQDKGYKAGWRNYFKMNGRDVSTNLWTDHHDAPFDKPFYLIMNLAVGGNFFTSNLNPTSKASAMYDHPLWHSGQLPSMFWYSRMKNWWASWSDKPLPSKFESVDTSITSFLEPKNTWNEYAYGAQDAWRPNTHKADKMTNISPPPDDDISDHSAFKIHRVSVSVPDYI